MIDEPGFLPGSEPCIHCGYRNPLGAVTCAACKGALPRRPGDSERFVRAWSGRQLVEIRRTREGVAIVLVGLVLACVPFLQFPSGVVLLWGAVLVVGGRGTFGRSHGIVSIGSLPLLAAALVAGLAFGAQFNAAVGSAGGQEGLRAASNVLLVGGLVVTILSSCARVLLVGYLLTRAFRIFLLVGFALEILVAILIYASMQPLVDVAIAEAYGSGGFNPDPIRTFQGRFVYLGFLYAIPLSVFIAVCVVILRRIRRREIPAEPPASKQSSRILRPGPQALQYSSPPLAPSESSSEGYEPRDIGTTRLGLGCMSAGVIIAGLPWVGVFGDIVILCGISALAFAWAPFGSTHRRMVLFALAFSIVGVIWFRQAFFAYGFEVVRASSFVSPSEGAIAVRAAFAHLGETVLPGILIGVAYSVATMGLQSWRGIAILGVGVTATAVARVAIVEWLRPAFDLAATEIGSGAPGVEVVPALSAMVVWVQFVALLPAGILSMGFVHALGRIRRREIPRARDLRHD